MPPWVGGRRLIEATSPISAATGSAARWSRSSPAGPTATAIQSFERSPSAKPVEAHRKPSSCQPSGRRSWASFQTRVTASVSFPMRASYVRDPSTPSNRSLGSHGSTSAWRPTEWSLPALPADAVERQGNQKMRYELTLDAVDLGLSVALPAQLETGGHTGGFGRVREGRASLAHPRFLPRFVLENVTRPPRIWPLVERKASDRGRSGRGHGLRAGFRMVGDRRPSVHRMPGGSRPVRTQGTRSCPCQDLGSRASGGRRYRVRGRCPRPGGRRSLGV